VEARIRVSGLWGKETPEEIRSGQNSGVSVRELWLDRLCPQVETEPGGD